MKSTPMDAGFFYTSGCPCAHYTTWICTHRLPCRRCFEAPAFDQIGRHCVVLVGLPSSTYACVEMVRWLQVLGRELAILRRVWDEPAPHRLQFALAAQLALEEGRDGKAALMVPRSPSGPAMADYAAAEFSRRVRDLLLGEDATATCATSGNAQAQQPEGCSKTRVAPSSIPGAGAGLWTSRDIRPGEVVCTYPGTLYAPPGHFGEPLATGGCYGDSFDLSNDGVDDDNADSDAAGAHRRPPAGSVFVMSRPGGFKIDASTVAGGEALRILMECRSVHATGHKIQHPPAGVTPNVIEVPILYRLALPSPPQQPTQTKGGVSSGSTQSGGGLAEQEMILPFELRHRIPHWWAPESTGPVGTPVPLQKMADPGWNAVESAASQPAALRNASAVASAATTPAHPQRGYLTIPGVAMVAVRELPACEELFLDYGFVGAKEDLPAWYAPVPSATVCDVVVKAEARLARMLR